MCLCVGLVQRQPTLRKLETESMLAYSAVLFRMYSQVGAEFASRRSFVRSRLLEYVSFRYGWLFCCSCFVGQSEGPSALVPPILTSVVRG